VMNRRPRSTTRMSEFLPKRVMVTGAAGLVGRTVTASLVRTGIDVLPVVHSGSRSLEHPISLDLAQVDTAGLIAAVPYPPQAIVHLAAVVPTRPENHDDHESAVKTLTMTKTIAEAAAHWNSYLVYMSGCSLYDPGDPGWKDESAPVTGRTPYLQAKLKCEKIVIDGNGVSLRVSGPVGSGMGSKVVLSRFLQHARYGRQLELWGRGTREQDFIVTSDIATAVIAALVKKPSGLLNIASGRPITMRKLAMMVIDIMGSGSLVEAQRNDPLDGETARYCIDKAARVLGWHPTHELATELRRLRDGGLL